MDCGKDLAKAKKLLAIKEIANAKTSKSIAEKINRCVLEKSFKEETSV